MGLPLGPTAGPGGGPVRPHRLPGSAQVLGQGFSTSAIAARMDLSPRTVESYFARIQGKLDLQGMHALRRHAYARKA